MMYLVDSGTFVPHSLIHYHMGDDCVMSIWLQCNYINYRDTYEIILCLECYINNEFDMTENKELWFS